MKLRRELEPDLREARRRYPLILSAISDFDNACDAGDESRMDEARSRIASISPVAFDPDCLFEYWESESKEELAFRLSLDTPVKAHDITRDELAEIIRRITSFDDSVYGNLFSDTTISIAGLLRDGFYIPLLAVSYDFADCHKLFNRQKRNGRFVELTADEIMDELVHHTGINYR
ncbi:MAG TPA: hypothetical protein PKK43_10660 [Spirochaetota bacterium]|nr:hypothetical protein [Spirochaetota bacterium]